MNNNPFDHIIIDDFLEENLADKLSLEFMDYDDPKWYCYNNPSNTKKPQTSGTSFHLRHTSTWHISIRKNLLIG